MKRLYTILVILSFLALIVYYLVPEQYFTDFVYPLHEGSVLSVYDDRVDGGSAAAQLSLVDSTLVFSCKVGDKQDAQCGLLWNFSADTSGDSLQHYRNWMLVDTLVFDIETKGTDELVVILWTYDPDVTNPKNKFSFRPLIKELKNLKPGRSRITLPISETYVPDYWYKTQNVRQELQLKHLEGAARLEIRNGWKVKPNQQFSVTIYSIEAKGISSFSLGILIFFFLAVAVIAVGVRHKRGNVETHFKK